MFLSSNMDSKRQTFALKKRKDHDLCTCIAMNVWV
jgi:hypothetical protein